MMQTSHEQVEDLYAVLGVRRSDSAERIRHAHVESVARATHPEDRQLCDDALRVLADAELRGQYDELLDDWLDAAETDTAQSLAAVQSQFPDLSALLEQLGHCLNCQQEMLDHLMGRYREVWLKRARQFQALADEAHSLQRSAFSLLRMVGAQIQAAPGVLPKLAYHRPDAAQALVERIDYLRTSGAHAQQMVEEIDRRRVQLSHSYKDGVGRAIGCWEKRGQVTQKVLRVVFAPWRWCGAVGGGLWASEMYIGALVWWAVSFYILLGIYVGGPLVAIGGLMEGAKVAGP